MTGPNRRDVERAIDRAETRSDGGEEDDDGGGRDTKAYAGIDLDGFPLPESAREIIGRASEPDTRPPVIAVEDDEDGAERLSNTDQADAVGFDPDTALDGAGTGAESE